MKLSIKNVKINQTLSEETLCFSADVYVNGKKAFHASNRGMGGANEYYPAMGKTYAEVDKVHEYAKTLPHRIFSDSSLADSILIHTYPVDTDVLVDDLLRRWQLEKNIKKLVQKISFIDNGKVYSLNKAAPTDANIAAYKARYPNVQMLNGLSMDEACVALEAIGA